MGLSSRYTNNDIETINSFWLNRLMCCNLIYAIFNIEVDNVGLDIMVDLQLSKEKNRFALSVFHYDCSPYFKCNKYKP